MCVTPVVPHDGMDNAGGNYLQAVHRWWVDQGHRVDVLAPDVPINRRNRERPGAPTHVRLLGRAANRWQGPLTLAAHQLDRGWRRVDPSAPPLSVVVGLLLAPESRAVLRDADIVDLQWSEQIRLAPLLQRLAPRARLVATFHDVLSQRFDRNAATADPARSVAAWRRAARLAGRSERAAGARFDVITALSDKDGTLLARQGVASRVITVDPPLADGSVPVRRPSESPTVIFVGSLSRTDNADAVVWLCDDIWPRIAEAEPAARLLVVGSNPTPDVVNAVARTTGAELTGFVPDLAEVYARAWVAVVPLRRGAGVKFKTIEAMVANVPTVATTVGAEGISAADRIAGVVDDAEAFAAVVSSVLEQPEPWEATATDLGQWSRERYGPERFAVTMAQVYGA